MKAILTGLLIFISSFSFAQSRNAPCNTLDHHVQQTLKVIQTRDTALYAQMADIDTLLSVMQHSTDSLMIRAYEAIKDKPYALNGLFKDRMGKLLQKIDQKTGNTGWTMKYLDMEVKDNDTSEPYGLIDLQVNVLVNNKRYHFTMQVSKHRGCYYLFAPVGRNFMENN